MRVIDGSVHEGGGSILRVAVPIAVATGEPIRIINIRKNRKKPGLRLQHLLVLKFLTSVTKGEIRGAEIGSTEVKIIPGGAELNTISIDIRTAASVPLLMQAAINYVVAGGDELFIDFSGGGTHTKWAPTTEYMTEVTAPALENFGIKAEITTEKVGFYPKGGAKGTIFVRRSMPSNRVVITEVDTRMPPHIQIVSSDRLKSARVGERIMDSFISITGGTGDVKYVSSPPGVGATAVSRGRVPYGASQVGERGLSSEELGKRLGMEISSWGSEPIDQYLSDQLVLPLAFSKSKSVIKVHNNPHTLANIQVVEEFFPGRIQIEKTGAYLLLTR